MRAVQKGTYDFNGEEWTDVSKEAKDLIKKLIVPPEKRLTAQEALDHKWFKLFKKQNEEPTFLKKRNLNAFKKFMKGCKIQQAALTAIAVQASPDDIKELKETFKALDKNGDGTITFEELKAGLGHKEQAETLIEMLKGADLDNSGSIDYTEFLAATLDAQIYMRDDYLKTAFDMFDKDGSGKIDKNEIISILQGEDMENMIPKDLIAQYIQEIDQNGDGEIDFIEFQEMMSKCSM